VSVYAAYPSILKIGDFLLKDKAKRFKSNHVRYDKIRLFCRSMTKVRKKLKELIPDAFVSSVKRFLKNKEGERKKLYIRNIKVLQFKFKNTHIP